MRNGLTAVLAFIVLIVAGCKVDTARRTVMPAFYYWKTHFHLSPFEKAYIQTGTVKKIYLHFFDLDIKPGSQMLTPVGTVTAKGAEFSDSMAYIPVVYIVNSALLHASQADCDSLPSKMLRKISEMGANFGIRFAEIQLDCDWTISTRSRYFNLVNAVRSIINKVPGHPMVLSVTLRLHQISYGGRYGVPPADRVMLMLYNMTSWRLASHKNAMYDSDLASKFLSFARGYPLPIDIALPLLRWTLIYRNNRFLTYLNYLDETDLTKCTFLKQQNSRVLRKWLFREKESPWFETLRDTLVFGLSLSKGDILKPESIDAKALSDIVRLTKSDIGERDFTLSLFHLDEKLLNRYTTHEIQNIFITAQ